VCFLFIVISFYRPICVYFVLVSHCGLFNNYCSCTVDFKYVKIICGAIRPKEKKLLLPLPSVPRKKHASLKFLLDF